MTTPSQPPGRRPGARRRRPLLAAALIVGLAPVLIGVTAANPPIAVARTSPAEPHSATPARDDLAQPMSWPRTPPRGDSPPTVFQHMFDPPPARDRLRTLATGISAAPGDAEAGRFAFIHARQWARDTDDTCSPGTVRAVDEYRWRAADGSGRAVSALFPAREPGPGPNARRHSTTYPRGELSAAVPDPLTADPVKLARQIDAHQPPENGPHGRLRGVADINVWQVPNLAVRRAIFTMLGDTRGLRYRGLAVDRAGRIGVAFTIDSGAGLNRDVLIVNPNTGELLAYEMVLLRDPGCRGITAPIVENYELYLYHGRRPHTRVQHQPTAPAPVPPDRHQPGQQPPVEVP